MKRKPGSWKGAVALAAGAAAIVAGSLIGRSAPPPPQPRPHQAELWTVSGAASGAASAGDRLWLAAAGGLVALKGPAIVERPRPGSELAWRGLALHGQDPAMVGLRRVAWRHAGRWREAALPAGAEGYSIAADGAGWWIGHSGGLQRLDPKDGLSELRRIGPVRVVVADGLRIAALGDRAFAAPDGSEIAAPPGARGPWSAAVSGERLLLAGAGGDEPLAVWEWRGRWRRLGAVPGTGSHLTALSPGPSLVAACAGDGWYEHRGGRWRRMSRAPAPLASDTSVLARVPDGWIGGARSGGFWRFAGGRWERLPDGADLPAGNVQAAAELDGRVYLSTFDQGLLVRENGSWRKVSGPDAPRYPRHLAAVGKRLFVREADGALSAYDGRAWERNLLRHRLRRSWMASVHRGPDGLLMGGWGCIVAGQPGVWKEYILPAPWDRETVTTLHWSRGRIAFGTARRGLAWFDPESGSVTPVKGGPADPWITTLAGQASLVAGAASGHAGEAREGAPVAELPAPVTGGADLPGGGAAFVTRDGLYVSAGGRVERLACPEVEAVEPQCLLVTASHLWIGGRYGVVRMPISR